MWWDSINPICSSSWSSISIREWSIKSGSQIHISGPIQIRSSSILTPCIIKNKNRRSYIHTLEKIRNGDSVENFVLFVAQELKESMVFMQKILSKKEVLINPFKTRNKEQRKDIIENSIGKTAVSISQIEEIIPSMKRATLKKDLKELLEEKRIKKSGERRTVVYFREEPF